MEGGSQLYTYGYATAKEIIEETENEGNNIVIKLHIVCGYFYFILFQVFAIFIIL